MVCVASVWLYHRSPANDFDEFHERLRLWEPSCSLDAILHKYRCIQPVISTILWLEIYAELTGCCFVCLTFNFQPRVVGIDFFENLMLFDKPFRFKVLNSFKNINAALMAGVLTWKCPYSGGFRRYFAPLRASYPGVKVAYAILRNFNGWWFNQKSTQFQAQLPIYSVCCGIVNAVESI